MTRQEQKYGALRMAVGCVRLAHSTLPRPHAVLVEGCDCDYRAGVKALQAMMFKLKSVRVLAPKPDAALAEKTSPHPLPAFTKDIQPHAK